MTQKQEAQLPQMDRATRHVSKFVLWEVIQGHWQWCQSMATYNFLLVFHCTFPRYYH